MTKFTEPLPVECLRWRCDPAGLGFRSTAEVEPAAGIVGQPLALDALRFGLETRAPGQNVFVRGLTGTGRMSMIERLLDEFRPNPLEGTDRGYVHHFAQPDRPRLVTLPGGAGRRFRRRLQELAHALTAELPDALTSASLQAARAAIEARAQEAVKAATAPFEAELAAAGLAITPLRSGSVPQMAILPRVQGQPVSPEQLDQLVEQGAITSEQRTALLEDVRKFTSRLPEMSRGVAKIYRENAERFDEIAARTVAEFFAAATERLRAEFTGEDVAAFLDEVADDVLDQIRTGGEVKDAIERYGVNIVLDRDAGGARPLVIERTPTAVNLLGSIEAQWTPGGAAASDYRSIRPGALLRADGGYLVLDAADLLSEPGAWRLLVRTLRSRSLVIAPVELGPPFAPASLKPQPIPVNVRVILVGSAAVYYQLEQLDRDFSDLFKVLADFDAEVERGPDALAQYAGVLSRIARDEGLAHFEAEGVAALAEHGARIAARANKLTTRFGRLADIARESAFVAEARGASLVSGADVREAVRRTKSRASLPSVRFQSFIKSGTIRVQTAEAVVGQINGLAVMTAGPLTYGFPARITATIGPGAGGIIDIESRSDMSGSIHTKGFHILGGLLRHLLGTRHPLTFSASLAFEQSYGGIDGDSASGAETCCLLSALTGIPIRQSIAMTGAIDQLGAIQSIGGVNEKVEGFFDICEHFGSRPGQGVIVPAANAGDLMLRHDVVAACAEGRFAVWAVGSIQEALELLTGVPAGIRGPDGFPAGTVLGAAVERAELFWRETVRAPGPA